MRQVLVFFGIVIVFSLAGRNYAVKMERANDDGNFLFQ